MTTPDEFIVAGGLDRLYKACARDKRIAAACQDTAEDPQNAAHDAYLNMCKNWSSILGKCPAGRKQLDYLVQKGLQLAIDAARSKRNGHHERRTETIRHRRESDCVSVDGTSNAENLFTVPAPDVERYSRINADATNVMKAFLIRLCRERNDLHRLLMRAIYDPPSQLNAAARREINRAIDSWHFNRRIPASGKHGLYRFVRPNNHLKRCCPWIDDEWEIPSNAKILGETLGIKSCVDDVIWTTDDLLTEPYRNGNHGSVVYVEPKENEDGSWRANPVILWPGQIHPPPTYKMSPYSYLVADLILVQQAGVAA